ncbi:Alpha/Beta hydrolase protein [Russula aff. rugulosa BPL654]|nr:Alpha/Beta hydrolase protein [Russula aff. rugulosa BPL654]
MHRGIFIHSVYVDPNSKKDLQATFYGNVDEQVELVARQLKAIPFLSDGFDVIGFSQGSYYVQFLRAYIGRYNDPPVRNLITFGSPHMDISYTALQTCVKRIVSFFSAHITHTTSPVPLVGNRPNRLTRGYLKSNHFLTYINNEWPARHKNETNAANLA